MTRTERRMVLLATKELQYKNPRAVLYPEEATVYYPTFDPRRASQPLAIISVPAIINMAGTVLKYNIMEQKDEQTPRRAPRRTPVHDDFDRAYGPQAAFFRDRERAGR